MPVVFGESVSGVAEIVRAFRIHGERVRGVYRARYAFDERSRTYCVPIRSLSGLTSSLR